MLLWRNIVVICFNCSRGTKEILERLVDDGLYADYSDAISSAIANLAILQDRLSDKGILILGQDSDGSGRQDAKQPVAGPPIDAHRGPHSSSHLLSPENATQAGRRGEIPQIFRSIGKQTIHEAAKIPGDISGPGAKIPLDKWIFGQYNRLLPAKASCRALANLLIDSNYQIGLDEAGKIIAEEATALGVYLRTIDQESDHDRDHKLSIAFPRPGRRNQKSRLRYATQFVAGTTSKGQATGLLVDLKLANLTFGKTVNVNLTVPGWQFAQMENPILDGNDGGPLRKFTEEEIEFMMAHIRENVPAEIFAYRSIMEAILKGEDTPDAIDTWLRRYLSDDRAETLSNSYLSAQRSGAISRMSDLTLVERQRNGVKVKYRATELAVAFLFPQGNEIKGQPQ
jgi:hypothetical protein